MTLSDGRDVLVLLTGNNTVKAKATTLDATDSLKGGSGFDQLALGGGGSFDFGDVTQFSGFERITTDNAGTIVRLGPGSSTPVLSGSGNDQLYGAASADVLIGNAGNDRIQGGIGNDKLTGGIGRDTLADGADADTFVYKGRADSTLAGTGRDLIRDFSHAQHDRIDLRLIDASTKAAGNQAFTFVGTKAFTEHAGELQARKVGSDTLISGDVNGDGKADFAILLDTTLTLQKGDFIL